MTKNDKKVLYMNDVPMFRYVAGGFVVLYYIFCRVWEYWLSPLSKYYREFFDFNIYDIFPFAFGVLFYILFIILIFIPLNKSWRYFYLIEAISFILSIVSLILTSIDDYSLRRSLGMDVSFYEVFSSVIPIIVTYLLMFFVFLRPFYQHKLSKYVVLIFTCLVVFVGMINVFSYVKDLIEYFNGDFDNAWRTCYYCGNLMEGDENAYFFLNHLIQSVPMIGIYYFILSLFIKVKKPDPAPVSPAFEYNPYQPQINSYQYPVQSFEVRSTAEVVNNQNIAEPTVSVNAPVTFSADDIPIAPGYEGTIPVFAPTPIMEQEPTQAPQSIPAFCNQCGYKMPDDFAFCPKCGKKFR